MVSVTQSDRSCALHDFAKRGNVDEIDRLLSADGYGIGQEAAPIIDSMDKLVSCHCPTTSVSAPHN